MSQKLESLFSGWTNPVAGEFFFTSSGDYSSYGIDTFYRVLKDIDIAASIEDYRTRTHRKNGLYEFLKFLSRRGDIDEVPTRELHQSDSY